MWEAVASGFFLTFALVVIIVVIRSFFGLDREN